MTFKIHEPTNRVATVTVLAGETPRSSTIHATVAHRIGKALTARMSGPGGYYNIGNFIGLAQGVAAQMLAPGDLNQASWTHPSASIADYLAGNASAIAMTAATMTFFVSGEVYHRAWSGPRQPNEDFNRLGDFLSGVGAVCLGLALLALGHPLLAMTSGLLHALGKFGSAWHGAGALPFNISARGPDPFRSLVLFSRLPAMVAAILDLNAAVLGVGGGPLPHWTTSAALLVCYLLWSRADLLLFRSSDPEDARDRAAS